jgi:hypothetical protein
MSDPNPVAPKPLPPGSPPPDPDAVATTGEVEAVQRTWLTEDWLATAVGLVLVLLVLAGAIPKGLVP